jgi:hypothetical protein
MSICPELLGKMFPSDSGSVLMTAGYPAQLLASLRAGSALWGGDPFPTG